MLVRKFSALFASALFLFNALFVSCKTENSTPFTGLKISADSYGDAGGTVKITGVYYNEDVADSSSIVIYTLSSDTTEGAFFGTSGIVTTKEKSGSAVTLTLGSTGNGSGVKVTATCNGSTAEKTIYTKSAVSVTDTPIGYAGVGFTSFYDSSKVVTVTTKADLVTYAKKGGYTIFVDGMIDLSEGMLPTGTSGNSTTLLDAFVAANSDYSTYAEYNSAKLSGIAENADWTNPLNSKYRSKVVFSVAAKTAIIGKTSNCGVKGGGISISSSNVIIRNLVIQDGYDPFPNHEKNDGWNGQIDAIAVGSANHIWIDHCTIEDTIKMGTAPNASKESASNHKKFQTYDGLCDITKTSTYVTVSNCILRNHDKTMLIGSGSSDTNGGYITLANNRFYGCGQRLPLTCYTNMHIYNNYYGDESGFYSNSYAIGARYAAYKIIAEGNYFGSGISDAFKASTSPSGSCYASGNSTNSGSLTMTSTKPFTVPYEYSLLSYSEAKSYVSNNAGAGVISVK